jgi:hypothetical protein
MPVELMGRNAKLLKTNVVLQEFSNHFIRQEMEAGGR